MKSNQIFLWLFTIIVYLGIISIYAILFMVCWNVSIAHIFNITNINYIESLSFLICIKLMLSNINTNIKQNNN